MSEERLVNLNMKDCILEKWKSKLSYPLNQKDIEELENIIDYYQQENQQLKESYCNRTDCSGRLHDSRKYPSVKQQLDLYKSVLDEIREYIESNKREASSHFNGKEYVFINYWLECDPNDLLQILDKVKK